MQWLGGMEKKKKKDRGKVYLGKKVVGDVSSGVGLSDV
jgi:hypothetical protein